MAESIADLAAHLGLEVDKGSFDSARDSLNQLAQVAMNEVIVKANEMAKATIGAAAEMNAALKPDPKTAAAWVEDLKKQEKGHKDAAEAAEKHAGALGWVKNALGAMLGLQAAKGLFGLISHTVEAGANMGDLADKTGMAVEEIQELGYAGNIFGMSAESMSSTMNKLAINLDKAAKKGGELAAPFKKAGIAIKDAEGKVRPSADVLADIADRIKSLDAVERPAEAMKLLGKQGKALIPLLKEGSGKLAELRQEAHDMGLVMSKETIEAMDKVQKDTKRLGKAWEGLKEHAVTSLIPALKDLTENLLVWVKANKEDIAKGLHAVFSLVVKVIKVIAVLAKGVIKVVAFLANNVGLVTAAVMGLAAAFAILEAKAIGAAVKSAAAWIVNPIFFLAAGIALAILLLDDLYAWISGQNSLMGELLGPADEILDKVGEKIKAVFEDALNWVINKAKEAWNAITGSIDFDEATKEVARRGHAAGRVSDADLAKAEKFGFSGQNDAGSFDQIKHAVDQKTTPQINVPPSAEALGTTVNAPMTQINNITGDPATIMLKIAEQQAVLARQLETTLGGAKRK